MLLSPVDKWLRSIQHSLAHDPELFAEFEAVDWSATALGTYQHWSFSLRSHVSNLFHQKTPYVVTWGDHSHCIYNSNMKRIMTARQTSYVAITLSDYFGENTERRDKIMATTSQVRASGERQEWPMEELLSAGFKRDVLYGSFIFTPLLDDDGTNGGVLVKWLDMTESVYDKRKDVLLQNFEQGTYALRDTVELKSVYDEFARVFTEVPKCTPLAVLYERHGDKYHSVMQVGSSCDPALTIDVDRITGPEQFAHWVAEAAKTGVEKFYSAPVGYCTERAFGRRSSSALVAPLCLGTLATDCKMPSHVLILSANPQRYLGDAYKDFLRQIVFAVSSAINRALRNIQSHEIGVIQAELAKSNARFRSIVQILPVAVAIESRERKFLFVNEQWRTLSCNQSPIDSPTFIQDSLNALDPTSFTDPRIQAFYTPVVGSAYDHPHLPGVEVKMQRSFEGKVLEEGAESWVRAFSAAISEDEIVGMAVDISQDKAETTRKLLMQKTQSEAQTALERADNAEAIAKQHLEHIDFLSHELRNPLSAIFQALDMSIARIHKSQNDAMPFLQEDFAALLDDLETVTICTKHMQRIMDDTLIFSQIEYGKLSISHVPCDLAKLACQVKNMFRVECSARGVLMTVHAEPDIWVLTDPNRLSQILINLIANSLKFSPPEKQGQIDIVITSDRAQNSKITCKVVDNGKNISDKELQKLFQRFSQANAKTHIEYGGSGLGLFICKSLTTMLDGDITAYNNDSGMTFEFFFMAKTASMPEKIDRSSRPTLFLPAHIDSPVLVVEDNVINQKLMRRQLEQVGYKVLTAGDGLEALEIFQRTAAASPIRLCLCDIEMPRMNGYQTVQAVKSWQREHGQPESLFIAISANVRPEQIKRALDSGMDAAVPKPFKLSDLLDKMSGLTASIQSPPAI